MYTGPNLIIYLHDKRRTALQGATLLFAHLQHVIGGLPLLFVGLERFTNPNPNWPLAVLEIGIASLVVAAFIREMRHGLLHRKHDEASSWHEAISWFDLTAGGLLIFEAFHQPHVKPGYLRPPFFAGVVTIVGGMFHGRLRALGHDRCYLKLDGDGVDVRMSPFRRFSFTWAELKSVQVSDKDAVFEAKEGVSRAIPLKRYGNADEIRSAIIEHAHAPGVLVPCVEESTGRHQVGAAQNSA